MEGRFGPRFQHFLFDSGYAGPVVGHAYLDAAGGAIRLVGFDADKGPLGVVVFDCVFEEISDGDSQQGYSRYDHLNVRR